MSTTRRGFLGALLAIPVLARLAPPLPAVPAAGPAGDLSFEAHMSRRMAHYTGAIVPTKYAPGMRGLVHRDGVGREYILRDHPQHTGRVAGREARFL